MKSWKIAFALGLSALALPGSAATTRVESVDPLRFFEGSTESVSTTKIIMQMPFVSRSLGRGKINADGTLDLVQHVIEQGRREFDRHWHIREVGPGHFGGTMSEASGPVSIERQGNRYRFRFTLKDNLAVEQWLIPQADNMVSVRTTIRKFGIAVVHSDGWIRRTD